MTANRPPSCDLPPEFYRAKLKECFSCGSSKKRQVIDFVACDDCGICGPDNDPYGHKWNSIPRRSDVMEVLRLVEGVMTDMEQLHSQSESMTDECLLKGIRDGATGCFSESVRAAMQRLCGLFNFADKLRKEVKS